MSLKHIAVLVSAGRHPISGTPRYCRNDGLALALGLELAEQVAAPIAVLHAGNPANPALEDYLALGAKHINVIRTAPDTDFVPELAAQLGHADLILTGSRSENGEDSGLMPYLLAAVLDLPIVANALTVTPTADGIEVLQFLPKGKRRRVAVQLPAVVAVHPLAPVELRYAYSRRVSGTIEAAHEVVLSASVPAVNSWQVQPARKAVKLKAQEKKAGHARMLSAIASENKGGVVVIEGNHVEKAQVILSYLREHHLIDF